MLLRTDLLGCLPTPQPLAGSRENAYYLHYQSAGNKIFGQIYGCYAWTGDESKHEILHST